VEPENDQSAPIASRRPLEATSGGASSGNGGSPLAFSAAIFDMDGVVTNTTAAHSHAWKQTFDDFLKHWAANHDEQFIEFSRGDYLGFVDGRPRYSGVETFLKSRGIDLPRGAPIDRPGFGTVCALGNSKNVIFNQIIEREGVSTFDSSVSLAREMARRGIRIGLATSSYNSEEILGRTGMPRLFDAIVDGVESARRGLKGKPEPDIFSAAAADLGVANAQAIVIEDAVSGVQAGTKGGFALVIGIAREGNARELRESGADIVVQDLSETNLEQINRLVQDKRTGAR
jgi:beta-phosphoglucomutase-like phosphatase (HAD superfamily)